MSSTEKFYTLVVFPFLVAWLCIIPWVFAYVLDFVFGVDAPWYLDLLGGIFTSSVLIPTAIGCGIAEACGVVPPLF